MRQVMYIEYNPEIEHVFQINPSRGAPVFHPYTNNPEMIIWRKKVIDNSLIAAVEAIQHQGKGPLDIVIGGMYVLKNVTRIDSVQPSRQIPGFLCIEFEQNIHYG